jgi:uncharacterized membrane protein
MDDSVVRGETETANGSDETGGTAEVLPPGSTGDPETDAAPELVIATFPDKASALEAFRGMEGIKWAEKAGQILLIDAAVVHRDEGNNLHVEDELDWPGGVGALEGAGVGTILGMFVGPLGMVVGGAAGAVIGAATAARSDAGMSDERLMEFGNALRPSTSMIIAAVAHMWSATTADILARQGGEVRTMPLTDEMARQLHLARQLGLDSSGT